MIQELPGGFCFICDAPHDELGREHMSRVHPHGGASIYKNPLESQNYREWRRLHDAAPGRPLRHHERRPGHTREKGDRISIMVSQHRDGLAFLLSSDIIAMLYERNLPELAEELRARVECASEDLRSMRFTASVWTAEPTPRTEEVIHSPPLSEMPKKAKKRHFWQRGSGRGE